MDPRIPRDFYDEELEDALRDVFEDPDMNEEEEAQEDGAEYQPEAELADLVIVEREIEIENEEDSDAEWEGSEPEEEPRQEAAASAEAEKPYEISRSSRHEYLGDTEELSGRTVVEDNDCITIPILIPSAAHNLVLLPSQTLPLTIFCPMQQSMLRNVIAKDRIIGIIYTRIGGTEGSKFDQYGTTAEIYEYHSGNGGLNLSVKAKGRQRFRLLDTHRETTGCIIARVKILPEIRMPDPLRNTSLSSQLRKSTYQMHSEAGQKLQLRNVASIRSKSGWKSRRRAALLTPWPSWVYDMYDDQHLSIRLVNSIVKQFNMVEDKLEIPRDPQELSHWAAINLPLTDAQRLVLLSLNTATQRLRFILSITSQSSKGLLCNFCDRAIANTANIFCMSTEGPQGTFVNPDGYIHEMITVTKATHISLQGRSSTRHSWFPGYAWRIAVCSTCRSHVGWLFTAEKSLKPRSFYGITRSSVRTKMTQDESSSPSNYVI